MALTLTWDDDQSIWTAAKNKKFKLEIRTKSGVSEIINATYNKVTVPGPKPEHTAVAEPRTLVVIYEAQAEGKRVELWEINSAEEQLLRFGYHNSANSYQTLQIN